MNASTDAPPLELRRVGNKNSILIVTTLEVTSKAEVQLVKLYLQMQSYEHAVNDVKKIKMKEELVFL